MSVVCVCRAVLFMFMCVCVGCVFFFQAEDGIRDLVRSRGLGDVYKRQQVSAAIENHRGAFGRVAILVQVNRKGGDAGHAEICLLYTSDAADERSSVDLGGRRIIKKKTLVTTGKKK